MLPPVALVHSVEMIRDGGSLAAVFQGANGSQYWLLFPIEIHDLPSGEWERLGYMSPVVVDRQSGCHIDVSWQHAIVLIHQIEALTTEQSSIKWLNVMESTAAACGRLPIEVARIGGTRLNDGI